MARNPATIIRMLRAIDQEIECFSMVTMELSLMCVLLFGVLCCICGAASAANWHANRNPLENGRGAAQQRMSILTFPVRISLRRRLTPVLFVAHVLHPVDHPAVELFLDGDMRHGCRGCSAVPMFLAGGEPHHVARPNLFHRSAPALRPAASGRHN